MWNLLVLQIWILIKRKNDFKKYIGFTYVIIPINLSTPLILSSFVNNSYDIYCQVVKNILFNKNFTINDLILEMIRKQFTLKLLPNKNVEKWVYR